MSVKAAAEALEAALKTVVYEEHPIRVYRDLGANVNPPAAVLGAPELSFESGCPEPTDARFRVFVVVRADDRAPERLWELVPLVSAAIYELSDGVVVSPATPTLFQSGNVDLPAYEVPAEVPLT